jgi:hypothetical protein
MPMNRGPVVGKVIGNIDFSRLFSTPVIAGPDAYLYCHPSMPLKNENKRVRPKSLQIEPTNPWTGILLVEDLSATVLEPVWMQFHRTGIKRILLKRYV